MRSLRRRSRRYGNTETDTISRPQNVPTSNYIANATQRGFNRRERSRVGDRPYILAKTTICTNSTGQLQGTVLADLHFSTFLSHKEPLLVRAQHALEVPVAQESARNFDIVDAKRQPLQT